MGVFNYITGSHKTPCCQNKQSGWQSKAAKIKSKSGKIYYIDCLMQEIDIKDLHEGEIHTTCDKCNRYIQYNIKDGKSADWKDR